MADRIIAQRELRNNVAEVLRQAEPGQTFTITVRGRPVARLVPSTEPGYPRVDVPREKVAEILRLTADPELLEELEAAEAPIDFRDHE